MISAAIAIALAACGPIEQNKQFQEARKSAQAAQELNFNANAERENIKKRLELTSQPELVGYVALIHYTGKVALYTPVKGKLTSGGKRLTPPVCLGTQVGCLSGEPTPSDEGTWGSSNPYVYFWTPSGQYIQTDMPYVYSDRPLRLTEAPLITTDDVK